MKTQSEVKLALIGAGQIGSRHLQALAKLDRPAVIQLVDPSDESLARAKERFERVASAGTSVRLESFRSIDQVSKDLDLALITTGANVRRELTERLLAHSKVKKLILEKVLFQREKDYEAIGNLLEKTGTSAWVNCAFRMWPGYNALKNRQYNRLGFHVSGSQWGLACNAVHYLDMFCHLSGTQLDQPLNISGLAPGSAPSKRAGFIEVFGTLNYSGPKGDVSLTCYPDGNAPVTVHVTTDQFMCTFREDLGKAWIAEKSEDWKMREIDFPILYQSQLTQLAVQEILDRGSCPLPDFKTSARVHVALIRSLMKHLGRDSATGEEACPIT